MKLTWYGHACFLLESDGGMRLLTDPYPQSIYPHGLPLCDAVTVSHEHYDHNDTASLPGTPAVFRGTGSHTLGDIRLQGLSSLKPADCVWPIWGIWGICRKALFWLLCRMRMCFCCP